MPYKPKSACPVCRRLDCTDARHKPKPFATVAPTRQRRPEYDSWREQQRRKGVVSSWLDANTTHTEDGKRIAVCEECGRYAAHFVADHVFAASEHGEAGPLRVHCASCSRRQGGRIGNERKHRGRG